MTKQEIREIYGESVYQIRLRISIQIHCQENVHPQSALERADRFIATLQAEEMEELKARYE